MHFGSKADIPQGNSVGENVAMAAIGGEVITGGKDFDESHNDDPHQNRR
jgi:hypothetical protein